MNYTNLVGKTLAQYELREQIGQGGMSAAYRAYQKSIERFVVIKVLHESLAGNAKINARFNREARAIARLEHPHIVPLYDYGEQDGITYLVMRLMEGGTLANRLSAGKPIALPETVNLLKQLGSALDYAHSQGVIHRDIKPSNIMFDRMGNPYLLDFGIAFLTQSVEDITGDSIIGTPGYLSPEQIMSEKVGPQADQYALGSLIFVMLTGHDPFDSDNIAGLLYKTLNEPPPPVTKYRGDLPGTVNKVLARALAKKPADRFPTIMEFAQAFEAAVAGVQESAPVVVGSLRERSSADTVASTPITGVGLPQPSPPPQSMTAAPPRARSTPIIAIVVGLVIGLLVLIVIFSANQAAGFIVLWGVIGGAIGWSVVYGPLRRYRPVFERKQEAAPQPSRTTSTQSPAKPVDTPPPPVITTPPKTEEVTSTALRLDMLKEGTQLKQYELRKRLDTGEKNRVYKAYDTHMGKDVAIKFLNMGAASNNSRRLRFQQEARILRTLYNPHIVTFLDYVEEEELVYIVMPLLEGGTLKEKLNGQPLPAPKAIQVVKEIAGALDYLHSKNVIHRDLKSSNIMFDDMGNSFIVDFGIAKVQNEGMNLTMVGEVMGTPYNISPEQWIGLPVSPRSDQYSLGVLVFQMLTGKLPFESDNLINMLQKHVYEQPPMPSSLYATLPQAVDSVLLKSLAKKPEDRFATVRDFAEALEKAFQAPRTTAQVGEHIFISYSRSDHDYSRTLADHLRQNGFPVWIDDNIDYGDHWFKEIEAAINDSSVVIVVMSPSANDSEWVHKEILIAKSCKKPILPLLLKGKEFGILIDIQYVDITQGQMPGPDFFARLNHLIGA